MKNYKYLVAVLFLMLSCTRETGSSNNPPPEENIVFTIDIDPGTNVFPALGSSQDIKISLISKMPTTGITIDLNVKKDLDNMIISSGNYTSTLTPFTTAISNLIPGVLYTVTFTVTSKSKPSNSAIKSFKLARK